MAVFETLLFGGLLFVFIWLYLRSQNSEKYWKNLGIERVKPRGVLSNIWHGTLTLAQIDQQVYNLIKGKRFAGFYQFGAPVVYITDLDLMKHVFIKDFDHFTDRRGFEVEKSDPHFYFSLFNQNGEEWKELRSKMTPTFTTGKIRRMFQIVDSSSMKLVKALREKGVGEAEVNIKDFHSKITMDVIASTAFGIQTNLFEDPDSYFAKMGASVQQQVAGKNLFKISLIVAAPKLAQWLNLKITDDVADKFFSRVIVETLNNRAKTGEKREDFLQIMLEAKQGVLKQEEEAQGEEEVGKLQTGNLKSKLDFNDDLIIAQCLQFFGAGFDTVESLLLWAVHSLMANPDVQEKLHVEVKQAYESNESKFTYDSITHLEYLDRFVQEILRMYPPAVRLERRSVKPYKIPGTDATLPKGTLVQLPVFGLHRDPELWPEPEKFDPDRFLKENVSKRHACAYTPFGIGPRNCIGMRFAIIECKLILAHLALNFKFAPSSKTVIPAKFDNTGTLKPAGGVWTKVTSRF